MEQQMNELQPIITIVLVHIRPGKMAEFTEYDRMASAVLREVGATVEYTLVPYATAGSIATPDVVQVLSFPNDEALSAYDADPRQADLRRARDKAVETSFSILSHPALIQDD